jgi:glutaredoxin
VARVSTRQLSRTRACTHAALRSYCVSVKALMTNLNVKATVIELDEVGAAGAAALARLAVALARLGHAHCRLRSALALTFAHQSSTLCNALRARGAAGGSEMQAALIELTKQRTVPSVFIGAPA